jgi:hypothetical protein
MPFAPYSFVSDEIAVGGLLAYGEPLQEFGFVMNVAWELVSAGDVVQGRRVEHARLDDNDNGDIEPQVPEILRAVKLVAQARQCGHSVLVTCAAGRNRSATVVAEYLIQSGLPAHAVIERIRERRANSLGNQTFVDWLLRKR